MLDPHVHPFLDVPVPDDLVDDDPNSARGNVIDDTSPAANDR